MAPPKPPLSKFSRSRPSNSLPIVSPSHPASSDDANSSASTKSEPAGGGSSPSSGPLAKEPRELTNARSYSLTVDLGHYTSQSLLTSSLTAAMKETAANPDVVACKASSEKEGIKDFVLKSGLMQVVKLQQSFPPLFLGSTTCPSLLLQ